MFARLVRSPAAWVVILCIGGAVFFLRASLVDSWYDSRHMSSRRICFAHIGASDKPLPQICVSSEARVPGGPAMIPVIVSRAELASFLRTLQVRIDAPSQDRSAFGSYEVHDSDAPEPAKRVLGRGQMQAVVSDLIELLDSAHDGEKARLAEVLQLLG
jgi:hypothetical protein